MGRVKDWLIELELGMINEHDIADMAPTANVRASVLNSAKDIVNGQRPNDYGGPEDSFRRIGKLWEAYMDVAFTPSNVAIMLALMKVARLEANPKHKDSWVDLAGYAACGAECELK